VKPLHKMGKKLHF